jgi:phosphoribosylformylglycinamidine synthase
MKTKWSDDGNELQVTSPLSGVVTAMAPVDDVRVCATPELNIEEETALFLIKLNDKHRMAGSIFSEVTESKYKDTPDIDSVDDFKSMFTCIQEMISNQRILSIHDISDGGLITSLLEMCFTKKVGMRLDLSGIDNINEQLFSEESGFVIQVKKDDSNTIIESLNKKGLIVKEIANIEDKNFTIVKEEAELFNEPIIELEKIWRETSHAIQGIRDNIEVADSELSLLDDEGFSGLIANTSFDESQIKSFNTKATKPKVAILREQGVNGQNEMAAAFSLAGFDAVDVHMQDLLEGKAFLKDFQGMAVCGGFSYGDVLGAGGGWSKTILYNNNVKDQFESFFNNQDAFTLGVCNGCQMLSSLKAIIPGADNWPSFERNLSDQFEARLVQVKIKNTDSVLLNNMDGWTLPVASAHGEGRTNFNGNMLKELKNQNQIAINFVDSNQSNTEKYPLNPNGSDEGITGITAADGRITIMMPHPERVFRKLQMSWHPKDWKEFSPWMQIFVNARKFSDEN